MKVLIALDESDCSLAALRSVGERQWKKDTQFLVLSVVEPLLPRYARWHFSYMSTLKELHKELLNHTGQFINEQVERLRQMLSECCVSGEVDEGEVRDSIVGRAEEWEADMIIMGSHGRSGVNARLLGSVAMGVLKESSCSVEIVKTPALAPG